MFDSTTVQSVRTFLPVSTAAALAYIATLRLMASQVFALTRLMFFCSIDFDGGLSAGLPDVLAFPDLSTLLPVPWEPGVAHCIADVFNPDGSPSQESPRYVLRQLCEQFTELGLTHIYAPVGGMPAQKFVEDDYKTGADQMRNVGDVVKQFNLRMSAEFTRGSSFISTLPTMLRVTRAAAHPNVKPLVDCYHFWSGNNKLEDLDLLKPGEVGHVHFQDVPDIPRELLDNIAITRQASGANGTASGDPDLAGLRDRALIGVMVYTFARVAFARLSGP